MRTKIASVLLLGLLCVTLDATMCSAQTRTTPVEVENTPTVQSQQNGTWSVGITGTPNVAVTNTPSVSVTNTPSVSVSNSPTVKIDSVTNTISAPTLTKGVKLWTTDPTFSGSSNSISFNCSGYREVKVVIKVSSALTNPENLKVFPEYDGIPSGGSFTPGYVTFATPTNSIIQGAPFLQSSGVCMFVVPVLSSTMWFYVQNGTGSSVTIDSARSWAWLVN